MLMYMCQCLVERCASHFAIQCDERDAAGVVVLNSSCGWSILRGVSAYLQRGKRRAQG